MQTEVICTIGRYLVVMYTRCRSEPAQETRYRVLDRVTNTVVGAPFGYLDARQAESFAAGLDQVSND